mmetsp:Transcript_69670/g.220623  ORF Transcript_69670/g.220623 Transcript_69670/m.220623 type:complete len:459 (+) Transcript_69670:542-1918(+)
MQQHVPPQAVGQAPEDAPLVQRALPVQVLLEVLLDLLLQVLGEALLLHVSFDLVQPLLVPLLALVELLHEARHRPDHVTKYCHPDEHAEGGVQPLRVVAGVDVAVPDRRHRRERPVEAGDIARRGGLVLQTVLEPPVAVVVDLIPLIWIVEFVFRGNQVVIFRGIQFFEFRAIQIERVRLDGALVGLHIGHANKVPPAAQEVRHEAHLQQQFDYAHHRGVDLQLLFYERHHLAQPQHLDQPDQPQHAQHAQHLQPPAPRPPGRGGHDQVQRDGGHEVDRKPPPEVAVRDQGRHRHHHLVIVHVPSAEREQDVHGEKEVHKAIPHEPPVAHLRVLSEPNAVRDHDHAVDDEHRAGEVPVGAGLAVGREDAPPEQVHVGLLALHQHLLRLDTGGVAGARAAAPPSRSARKLEDRARPPPVTRHLPLQRQRPRAGFPVDGRNRVLGPDPPVPVDQDLTGLD